MNRDDDDLRRLFGRLNRMGVQSARLGECDEDDCLGCGVCIITETEVLRVLGEMMMVETAPIGLGDVLDAAKAAGVY